MKEKLSQQDKNFIRRHWKTGQIDTLREIIPDKEKTLSKLTKLGIVKQISTHKYDIDRSRFLECEDMETKQGKLF